MGKLRFENRYAITIKKGGRRTEHLRKGYLAKFTGKTSAKRYAKRFLKGKSPKIVKVHTYRR